jgi:hypothetical protein
VINADEARGLTRRYLDDYVVKTIQDMASSGESKCMFEKKQVTEEMLKILKDKGYTVKKKDAQFIEISWE